MTDLTRAPAETDLPEVLPPAGSAIHFVGVGGIGMSGLARLLHHWGYRVSGSDSTASDITTALIAEGIAVSIGHHDLALAGVGRRALWPGPRGTHGTERPCARVSRNRRRWLTSPRGAPVLPHARGRCLSRAVRASWPGTGQPPATATPGKSRGNGDRGLEKPQLRRPVGRFVRCRSRARTRAGADAARSAGSPACA